MEFHNPQTNFTAYPAQADAICHPPAPLMILAGAGTGKTTTLIYRIVYLVRKYRIPPKQIVILTFTERATGELRQRMANPDLLGSAAGDLTIATFHSFCNMLVREFGPQNEAERVLWLEHDIRYFFMTHIDELTFLTSRTFCANPQAAVFDAFLPFINRVQDELFTPEDVRQKFAALDWDIIDIGQLLPGIHEETENEEIQRQLTDLVQVYAYYRDQKSTLGVVDYGDMILDCWTMLNEESGPLSAIQARYQHLFVDEYQDNNYALNLIVNKIAGKSPSITVVGDEDQCIYSFRGANYYNIQDFRERYCAHPEYCEVKLEENRRSTQEILDVANASIRHNPDRIPKTLRTPDNQPKHGPKPVWTIAENRDTVKGIPEVVDRLLREKKALFGAIAVICRTWGHVRMVADNLIRSGLPADIHVEKLFSIPVVKDILAWGHLILDDPQTETALFRILHDAVGYPRARAWFDTPGIDSVNSRWESLQHILDTGQAGNHPEPEQSQALSSLEWILNTRSSLQDILRQHRQADEMVWAILNAIKQRPQFSGLRHRYRYAERLNLSNMGKLVTIAERFATVEDNGSLEAWLHYMDIMALDFNLEAVQPESYDRQAAVQVMTVHQSKGLEFPYVIVPFLRSGSFPMNLRKPKMVNTCPDPWKSWQIPDDTTVRDLHIREERRVFYVACTRAENELYLYGPTKAQSVFTKELESDSETLEIQTMAQEAFTPPDHDPSTLKQKLLVELNRELAAHQYANAEQIVTAMRHLDETGTLPDNHPYGDLEPHTEPTGESQPDRLLRLSASSIEEYDSCPLKYRLSHIDRVPERKSKAAMEFGIIMHQVLQDFHEPGQDYSLADLRQLLDKHWREEAFEYLVREQEFRNQGEEILTQYYAWNRSRSQQVAEREKMFRFTLEDLNVEITGKIDRLDRDGDRLAVLDYKTSQKKEKAHKSLQLALYVEALRRDAVDGIQGDPGEASLLFLRHIEDEPLESHEFSLEDLAQHRDKVRKVTKGIRRGKFDPDPNDYKCRHCDYREFLCPAWEDS